MICPICTESELRRKSGGTRLGGWGVSPDTLQCPHCGSTLEAFGTKVRVTFVPAPYAVFLGQALAGSHTLEECRRLSTRAREAVVRQEAIRSGSLRPCQAPIDLRPTETCVYTVSQATLEEERTRQGQNYWAAKATGPLTITKDNVYVSNQATPIRKINDAILRGHSIHIGRSDRKRATRITFADGETAYFAALAMSRVVGVMPEPLLSEAPLRQKGLGMRLSIPIGKGRRKLVPPWTAAALLALLALTCPCAISSIGGLFSASDVEPTSAGAVAAPPTISRSSLSLEDNGTGPVSTATLSPTDTVEPTSTVEPTQTSSPTPKPSPSATPTRTPEPANCWNAAYIADVTIPDGTWIEPGDTFVKTWRVRNAGDCAWEDVMLSLDSGDDFGVQEIAVPDLAPGETADVTVEMTAPSIQGSQRSVWQYSHAGVAFGTLTLLVNVGTEPTAIPPTEVVVQAPPTPTSPPAAVPGKVIIRSIYYDGQVPRVESDEYAVIKNTGGSPVNLAGWRLNAGNPGQDFGFPAFELQPGQECRVYTNEYHPDTCGFSFGNGQAIWNNGGDCGHLYDATGIEVSRYCY